MPTKTLTAEHTALLPEILTEGAASFGIELPSGACSSFETYRALLEKHGGEYNLTAITGIEDVVRLHFLDSLALFRVADFTNAKIIDIGSGAGFPGVPITLAEPSAILTLLDATEKRVAFLSELCAAAGINASCIHARAEEAAREVFLREGFDVAVSRAVARLNVLCELCLPFVRVGGLFLAMKGFDSDDEISKARGAIKTLGGILDNCYDYTIPGTDIRHRVVVIRKQTQTPEKYPRRFARIMKMPL